MPNPPPPDPAREPCAPASADPPDPTGSLAVAPPLCERARRYLEGRRRAAPDAALAGDWERFFGDVDPLLRRVARRRGRGVEPEDAAQEAWLRLVARIDAYRPDRRGGDFLAWLVVVARRRMANLERRAARRPASPLTAALAAGLAGGADDPAEECERRLARDEVRRALDEARRLVSGSSHRVIVLRWVEGRTVPEIAEALGLTPAQVRDRQRRTLPVLRGLLERRPGAAAGGPGPGRRPRLAAGGVGP